MKDPLAPHASHARRGSLQQGQGTETTWRRWTCGCGCSAGWSGASARMRELIAQALGVNSAAVSVKATRPEGLGLAGDGAGCLALAAVG